MMSRIKLPVLCMMALVQSSCGGGGVEDAVETSPDLVTVVPQDSAEVILNPGKGWVTYVGFTQKSAAVWDVVSTCYVRYTWATLQPVDAATFDWSALDGDLRYCKAKGKKFAFGVIPADSLDVRSSTPQWAYDLGVPSYTGVDGRPYPVWSDPIYQALQIKLVQALAERFDGDEDIAFIDARSYGNWGEWHLEGIGGLDLDDASKRRLLDAWAAFQHTDIMVPGYSQQSHIPYATAQLGFGIRYDSSDNPAQAAAAVLAKDVAPAVSEWSAPYARLKVAGGWTRLAWTETWIPTYMAASGYSYDNLGQWDTDSNVFLAEQPELVKTWANRMGYWFRVARASFPAHLGNGQAGTLTLQVRNDGVAPIFVNKKRSVVKLALLNSADQVVGTPIVLANVQPFAWKPGQTLRTSSSFTFPLTPGARKLAIGLFSSADKTAPDIRFGTQGQTTEGWLILSPGS